jgi:hypothetical protein
MPVPPPIADVPISQVGKIVQSFITRDDVKHLEVEAQAGGKLFTITPIDDSLEAGSAST